MAGAVPAVCAQPLCWRVQLQPDATARLVPVPVPVPAECQPQGAKAALQRLQLLHVLCCLFPFLPLLFLFCLKGWVTNFKQAPEKPNYLQKTT